MHLWGVIGGRTRPVFRVCWTRFCQGSVTRRRTPDVVRLAAPVLVQVPVLVLPRHGRIRHGVDADRAAVARAADQLNALALAVVLVALLLCGELSRGW
jgi:hypothetical protein